MTENKLQTLIDQAVRLDREVTEKSEQLKEIKALLVAEARSRDDERVAVDGAGSKWTKPGTDGCLCRVTFPGPRLKSLVDPSTKPGMKILEMAGTSKTQLFHPSVVYQPVDGFRDLAREILGGKAERLIKACQTESAPRVEFETKIERE